MVSPIVGAFLLDNVGTVAPGVLGALLMAWLISFTWRRVLFVPDPDCLAPVEVMENSGDQAPSP